jgi:hypothetical protein
MVHKYMQQPKTSSRIRKAIGSKVLAEFMEKHNCSKDQAAATILMDDFF